MNATRLAQLHLQQVEVLLLWVQNPEAELDEMWSFVQSKQRQRWLWQAVDHVTGEVLAYVLDTHEYTAFLQLKALLAPFGLQRFYTDGWGLMNGILTRGNILLVNFIPRRLSGNI